MRSQQGDTEQKILGAGAHASSRSPLQRTPTRRRHSRSCSHQRCPESRQAGSRSRRRHLQQRSATARLLPWMTRPRWAGRRHGSRHMQAWRSSSSGQPTTSHSSQAQQQGTPARHVSRRMQLSKQGGGKNQASLLGNCGHRPHLPGSRRPHHPCALRSWHRSSARQGHRRQESELAWTCAAPWWRCTPLPAAVYAPPQQHHPAHAAASPPLCPCAPAALTLQPHTPPLPRAARPRRRAAPRGVLLAAAATHPGPQLHHRPHEVGPTQHSDR